MGFSVRVETYTKRKTVNYFNVPATSPLLTECIFEKLCLNVLYIGKVVSTLLQAFLQKKNK